MGRGSGLPRTADQIGGTLGIGVAVGIGIDLAVNLNPEIRRLMISNADTECDSDPDVCRLE